MLEFDDQLLIDQVVPRSDLAVAHAGVFRVPPQVCYQTARQLDFFQAPLIRTLIGLRGLPQRLVAALTGHRTAGTPARPRLRLGDDLAGLGFSRRGGRGDRSRTATTRSGLSLGLGERIRTRLEHEVDRRSVRLGVGLLRLTKGRVARLWRRRALILTTRGRRSGLERTVPLQYFPDGENLIVVAANSGLASPPGWYFNLTANPRARVEVGGRTLAVRAEELSAEEAAGFWPQVLQAAPDYARYLRRTSRRIPLLRLIPATLDHGPGHHLEAVGHR